MHLNINLSFIADVYNSYLMKGSKAASSAAKKTSWKDRISQSDY